MTRSGGAAPSHQPATAAAICAASSGTTAVATTWPRGGKHNLKFTGLTQNLGQL
jgi:hypothetical protein